MVDINGRNFLVSCSRMVDISGRNFLVSCSRMVDINGRDFWVSCSRMVDINGRNFWVSCSRMVDINGRDFWVATVFHNMTASQSLFPIFTLNNLHCNITKTSMYMYVFVILFERCNCLKLYLENSCCK